jgi:SAM-dependent methyltransferase
VYLTRTVPPPLETILNQFLFAKEHLSKIRQLIEDVPKGALFYEIGAGWDLANALSLYCLGVERQTVTDLRRLMKPDLVRRAAALISSFANEHGGSRGLPDPTREDSHRATGELLSRCGISYVAPFDAASTRFPSESIDFITCTKVLQHVPIENLLAILRECRRVLKREGIMSALIDYRDNFSYSDSNISIYNFLRYSDEQWARWNPLLAYQNRLRHVDYAAFFDAAGFAIIEESSSIDGPDSVEALRRLPLADKFKRYSVDDLAAARGWYLLKPL